MERCVKDVRSDGTFPEGACDQPATQLVCVVEGGSAHPLCDAHADEARAWRHMLGWFRGGPWVPNTPPSDTPPEAPQHQTGGCPPEQCDACVLCRKRPRMDYGWSIQDHRRDRPYTALYPPVPGGEVPDDDAC
jgi:hypothetical protein